MNTPELFIIGAVVTLIVAGALALIMYGAIMDGRAARRSARAAEAVADPSQPSEPARRESERVTA